MAIIEDAIAEYTGLLTDKANLQNQLQTAALQHGNDQLAIGDLKAKVADLNTQLNDETAQFVAAEKTIDELQGKLDMVLPALAGANAQVARLQSTVTYGNLEYGITSNTDSAASNVGGGGLGTDGMTPPDKDGWATFWIKPNALVPPATANYFDDYRTEKFKPQPQTKNFYLTQTWRPLTQTDADNMFCLEMEGRQVLLGGDMFVPAIQLRHSDLSVRYFNHEAPGDNWVDAGIKFPKPMGQQIITVVCEARRVDAGVQYDAITINGTCYPVNFLGLKYNSGWGPRMSTSLQLDAKTVGFTMQFRDWTMKVW